MGFFAARRRSLVALVVVLSLLGLPAPSLAGTSSITPIVNPLAGLPAEGQLSAVACPDATCVGVGSDGNGEPLVMLGAPGDWGAATASQLDVQKALGSGGSLNAVACPSSTECVAVGSDQDGEPVVVSGSPATWTGALVQQLSLDDDEGAGGVLSALACPSTTSCVAVGTDSAGRPLILVGDPASWTSASVRQVVLGASFGRGGRLDGLSCPTPTACVAVGVDTKGQPFWLTGDPATWTVAQARKWDLKSPFGSGGTLSAAWCVSTASCVAVGWDRAGQPMSVVGDPATWTSAQVRVETLPASLDGASLEALQCGGVTACVAVGYDGRHDPFTLTGNPRTWSSASGSSVALANGGALSALTCSTTTTCVAAGFSSNGVDHQPLLMSGDPASWGVGQAVLTSLASVDFGLSASITALSCATATSCAVAAVNATIGPGEEGDFGTEEPFSIEGSPGGWTSAAADQVLLGPSDGSGGDVVALSCPAPDSCVGVGSDFDLQPIVVVGDPAHWSPAGFRVLTLPASLGSGGQLYAVWCASVTACVAVGADAAGEPVAVAGNPATWTSATVRPIALGSTFGSGGVLQGIACATVTSCVAVGSDDAGPHGTGEPIFLTGNAAHWSAAKAHQIQLPTTGFGGSGRLIDVACTSSTACLAVGQTNSQLPLVLDGNPATWTASSAFSLTVPALGTGASLSAELAGGLSGVSCASGTLCVAVGADGDGAPLYLYGNPAAWPGHPVERPTLSGGVTKVTFGAATCVSAVCFVAGTARQGAFIAPL